MKIPYRHIDKEMIPLIRIMNNIEYIETIGCCIGHEADKPSEVIFKVTNNIAWQSLMIKLLHLNNNSIGFNIDIFQWHRLSCNNKYLLDWLLKIEVHPSILDGEEALSLKIDAINRLVNMIKADRAATLSALE